MVSVIMGVDHEYIHVLQAMLRQLAYKSFGKAR